jgi:hypothetical protein
MNVQAWLRVVASITFLSGAAAQAAQKPQALKLEGDIVGAHDPSMIQEGSTYYVFTTGRSRSGGQLGVRCSTDLVQWRFCGQVFDAVPAWLKERSPSKRDIWAPDISSPSCSIGCITHILCLEKILPVLGSPLLRRLTRPTLNADGTMSD